VAPARSPLRARSRPTEGDGATGLGDAVSVHSAEEADSSVARSIDVFDMDVILCMRE
jgi:hypothetical protein